MHICIYAYKRTYSSLNKCSLQCTDGVVGEVLFWAIRSCVGDLYTFDTHKAWVKIYSRMLKTMVPVAVAHELKDGSAQVLNPLIIY
jgi:hemoglobin-like flavoprotein